MGQPLVCKSAREVDISVGRGGPAVADVWKPREFVWAVLLLQHVARMLRFSPSLIHLRYSAGF